MKDNNLFHSTADRKLDVTTRKVTVAAHRPVKEIDNVSAKKPPLSHHSPNPVKFGAYKRGVKVSSSTVKTTGTAGTNNRINTRAAGFSRKLDKSKLKLSPKGKYNFSVRIAYSERFKKKQILSGEKVNIAKAGRSAASIVGNAAKSVVTKPVKMVGNKLLSQRADTKTAGDTGAQTVKLGLQSADYARRGVHGVKNVVTAPKRVYKAGKRTINVAKRTVKTTTKVVKNTAKAVKTTAKVTQKMIKTAVKAVEIAVKATVKVIGFIAETSPWSEIIILAVLLVILIAYGITALIGALSGTNQGVGGWAVGESDSDEVDVYNNFKEFSETFKLACDDAFENDLKSEVEEFCKRDKTCHGTETCCVDNCCGDDECDCETGCCTFSDPRHIIIFNDTAYYTAVDHDEDVNKLIDQYIEDSSGYTTRKYADFMAALMVLKTREMESQESGMVDIEKFKKQDFEEFIGTLNEDTCDYGKTFFVKTTETTTDQTCPGAACRTEYRDDDCCSRDDGNGGTEYYCGGHPYCTNDHTKLTITLKSIDEFSGKSFAEIYGFTEDEQDQFDGVSEFITEILRSFEEVNSSETNP